jgi:hypothetical protein
MICIPTKRVQDTVDLDRLVRSDEKRTTPAAATSTTVTGTTGATKQRHQERIAINRPR